MISTRVTAGPLVAAWLALGAGPSGTGLALAQEGAGGGAAGAPIELAPITVEAARPAPPTAVIGTLPPPAPGGLVARGGQLGVLGNQDLFDVPFSITSFTREIIDSQQSRSPGDVLRNDASVQVLAQKSGGAASGGGSFNIRGFQVLGERALLNGLPGLVGRADTLVPFERIEIIKGPAALLTGTIGDVGGTINYVTKRAPAEPLALFLGRYEYVENFTGETDLAHRFGPGGAVGVRLSAQARDGEIAVKDVDKENRALALATDYAGERVRFTIDADYAKERSPYDNAISFLPGIEIPDPPRADRMYSQRWSRSDQESWRGVTRLEVDVADEATLFAAAGGLHFDNDYVYPNLQRVDADGNYSNPGNYFRATGDVFSSEVGGRAALATGPIRHEITLAGQYLWQESGFTLFTLPATPSNIFDPVYVSRPPITRIKRPDVRSEAETRNVGLTDIASILNGRASLTAGIRRTEVNNKSYDAGGTRTARYKEAEWTPAIGLVVKPLPQLSFYASYIEALEQGGNAPLTAANAGEALAPFVSEQYEVGAKLDLGWGGLTLAGFRIKKPSAVLDAASNRFEQDGEQVNRGLELSLFGEPVDGWRILASGTYIDAELTRTAAGAFDGNEAPGVPELQAALFTELDLPFAPGASINAGIYYTDEQYVDQANQQEIADFVRVDVGAAYSVPIRSSELIVRANVENLFDNNYWAGSLQGGSVTLGAPRTFLLSAAVRF